MGASWNPIRPRRTNLLRQWKSLVLKAVKRGLPVSVLQHCPHFECHHMCTPSCTILINKSNWKGTNFTTYLTSHQLWTMKISGDMSLSSQRIGILYSHSRKYIEMLLNKERQKIGLIKMMAQPPPMLFWVYVDTF